MVERGELLWFTVIEESRLKCHPGLQQSRLNQM